MGGGRGQGVECVSRGGVGVGVLLCKLGSSALSILMVGSLDLMMVFEEDLSL